MQEKEITTKEYEANWEENQKTESSFKKVFIPEDSYNANLKVIEVVELPDFNDKTKKLEKLALMFDIKEKGVELTHFLQPKISKGSTNKAGKVYSNSKLYDLLVDLNLKDLFLKLKNRVTIVVVTHDTSLLNESFDRVFKIDNRNVTQIIQ
jgi:hypothetical protein